MFKLAVIFESSPFDRKGLFNAVHNRIKHLLATGECQIDAYCIHSWDTAFTRKVRHTPYIPEKTETVEIESITYRMLWYDFSILDDILLEKLHLRPFFFPRFIRKSLPLLKGYDCISAHSLTGALVAQAASETYGIPYYVSWHGSEIHTHPLRNPVKFKDTASIIKGAACNFFVSRALLEQSGRITPEGRKEVLYNGVAEGFERFPDHCREEVRRNNGLAAGDKLVAFVGSIVAVKNVSLLQPLFHEIRAGYDGPLKFWMVGTGKLRGQIESAMAADPSIDVTFWGDIPPENMPSVMNCIDVLVLPSLNEGLPLVCAEAIRCGAAVVGSDVGGIPEVIGSGFTIQLGPGFISAFASKVTQALLTPPAQTLPPELDWKLSAQKEISIISQRVSLTANRE